MHCVCYVSLKSIQGLWIHMESKFALPITLAIGFYNSFYYSKVVINILHLFRLFGMLLFKTWKLDGITCCTCC